MRLVVATLSVAVPAGGCSAGGAGSTGAAATGDGFVSIGAGLRGPAWLKATVYATGLSSVSAFAFDSEGRLWATTSGATDHAGGSVEATADGRYPDAGAFDSTTGPVGDCT